MTSDDATLTPPAIRSGRSGDDGRWAAKRRPGSAASRRQPPCCRNPGPRSSDRPSDLCIPLRRHKEVVLYDQAPRMFDGTRSELVKRLLADTCEMCGSQETIEVHHIRKLADLNVEGRPAKPAWVKRMAARRRKTLVVCQDCHDAIHAGRATRQFSRHL